MKAILTIDMPNYCSQCELCVEDKYADYQCVALLESVNVYKKEKLKDCPLKPVQTGQWETNFTGNEWIMHCSKCNTEYYEEDLLMAGGGNYLPKYCPECGIQMDNWEIA